MVEAFSKIPANTFKELGINAAMLLTAFTPATGAYNRSNIIGATTGGNTFKATPEYKDWGEDIDNCPKNTKELKRLTGWTVTMSGTFVSYNGAMAEMLAAAADNTDGHIVPRDKLNLAKDFRDIWLVGDYSDVNNGDAPGFIAVKMMNALSTGGLQIKTQDKEKMQFAYEFTGHYSIDAQDTVPFEVYVKNGEAGPYVMLDKSTATVVVGSTLTLTATKNPSNATVTWSSSSSSVATVSSGTVSPVAAGQVIIYATITNDGKNYTDACKVTVLAAS